ncbi:protein NO VEIN domain-containing protein [Chthonobacter rhizosphaerae]|uniref:protein NO VEIN domain-containing protein n=1 Tax=Chthonobacter rhizosphaerae TaxID=2735553 RepID=UPI001AED597F
MADYFAMLADEIAGHPLNKRAHNRGLRAVTGRSAGSIEFKHQNISAVLAELGLPWLRGYKPRYNYQDALIVEVEQHLTRVPVEIDSPSEYAPVAAPTADVFVPPPERRPSRPNRVLDRLVRKLDPGERDQRNRALGRAGEEFVLEVVQRRLFDADRADLMRKVCWVADLDGDGAGYDVRFFDPETGRETLIEVKTTRGDRTTPFYLTRNEEALSREQPDAWRIYRVFEFGHAPKVFSFMPALDERVKLSPATWVASF